MDLSPLFWKGTYAVMAAAALAVQSIAPSDAVQYVGSSEAIFLDVREAFEYETGHVPGSYLMPWSSGVLANRWEELPQDRLVIVYCASGGRSALAAQFLVDKGFPRVANMSTFRSYQSVPGAPVETGPYQEPPTAVSDWILH